MSFHGRGRGLRFHAGENDQPALKANLELARVGSTVRIHTGRVVDHEPGAPPNAMAAVVELQGEYDLTTARVMQRLLRELIGRNQLVIVDLSQALFIDSTFMRSLVLAHRLAVGPLGVVGLLDELDCFSGPGR